MTIEAFVQTPAYVIQGTGPYQISHPYSEGAIIAQVLVDSVPVELDMDEVTVSPTSSTTTGNLYLSAAQAATYAGLTLWIDRDTAALQGWEARYGDREAGMEDQLDRDTMALQELRALVGASLRGRNAMAAYNPDPGTVPIVRADGLGWESGPSADVISGAQAAAYMALVGSGSGFDTVADLVASTLTYGTSTITHNSVDVSITVAVGDYWTVKGQYVYQVVSSDAERGVSGYHVVTNGGVKLLVVGPHYSLAAFNPAGDGETDDTTAWNLFQGVTGIKEVPAGKYLVNSAVKRFDQGVIGNGVFDDDIATWEQAEGDRERDSLIVHQNIINANDTAVSPVIKTQASLSYTNNSPSSSQSFKLVTGAYHEETVSGVFNTRSDYNANFTVMGLSAENKMAGLFGTLGLAVRYQNVTETANPDLDTYGGNKGGCAFFQVMHNQKYESGGYAFGAEIYCQNNAEETEDIPYNNNDYYDFTTWTAGLKISAYADGAPYSSAIMINGSSSAKHGFWNGIVFGSSMWNINNNDQGPSGTVGINMASWRAAAGYADIGIKFRTANRHLHFVEGAKIRSSLSRFIYDEGACGLSLEGSDANGGYIAIKNGATSDANPSSSEVGRFSATATRTLVQSTSGYVALTANGSSYYASSTAFYPATSAVRSLGAASYLWSQLYASTATISTSDERYKQDIADLPDAVLDAWGAVSFQQFRFRDAAAEKGDDARLHSGVIAQRVVEAFTAEGLDATDYGLLCYDEWAAQEEVTETIQVLVTPEQVDADGNVSAEAVYEEQSTVVTPACEAGYRYGIRYEEALCLEAAYQRRRASDAESRITAMETAIADLLTRVTALEGN